MSIVQGARLAGVLLLACIAGACGGGGGGGSDRPHLSLSSAEVRLAADFGVTHSVETVGVAAQVSSSVYTVAYGTPEGPLPDWLSITGSWTDQNSLTIFFRPTRVDLPEGTLSTVVTFYAYSEDNAPLAQADVLVTYQIDAHVDYPSFFGPSATVVFGSSETGAEVRPIVEAAGETWTATSETPWIEVPEGVREGTRHVTVTINAAGLAVGRYAGKVRVAAVGEPDDFDEIPIDLTVRAPHISVAENPVLGGPLGHDKDPVALTFTLDTGTNAWPWTVEIQYPQLGPSGWLGFERSSGTVGAAGDSIMLHGDWTDLPRGSYTATMVFRLQVDGVEFVQPRQAYVRYEENLIYVVENGVALYELPGRSRPQASMQVINSQGRIDIPWTAQSDSAWLTVTASGNTGGMLEFTADASALAADEVHVARVTIESADPEIQNVETVVVSYWKGATDPATLDIETSFTHVAANPTLPYVHALSGATLRTFNVYNGELVSAVTLPADWGQGLAVGFDGLTAFVPGPLNAEATVVDILAGTTTSVSHGWRAMSLPFWRVDGIPYFYSASSPYMGRQFESTTADGRHSISAGNHVNGEFFLGTYTQIEHSALIQPIIGVQLLSMFNLPGVVGAVAAVPDKQHGLVAVSQPAELRLYDTIERELAWTRSHPKALNNALVRADGLLITGAGGEDGGADVWLFDLDGTPAGEYLAPAGSLLDRQLALSSDRRRLVIPTGSHIRVVELPPLGTPIPLD